MAKFSTPWCYHDIDGMKKILFEDMPAIKNRHRVGVTFYALRNKLPLKGHICGDFETNDPEVIAILDGEKQLIRRLPEDTHVKTKNIDGMLKKGDAIDFDTMDLDHLKKLASDEGIYIDGRKRIDKYREALKKALAEKRKNTDGSDSGD